jgi:hypothetical protein
MFNSHHQVHSKLNSPSSTKRIQTYSPLRALQEQLKRAYQNKLTGLLEIKAGDDQKWNAYFYFGRMIWLSGGGHPVRRLSRQLKLHSPKLNLKSLQLREMDELCIFEFQTLQSLKERDLLNEEQICKIAESIALEALFDICWAGSRSELNFFIVQNTFFVSIKTFFCLYQNCNLCNSMSIRFSLEFQDKWRCGIKPSFQRFLQMMHQN